MSDPFQPIFAYFNIQFVVSWTRIIRPKLLERESDPVEVTLMAAILAVSFALIVKLHGFNDFLNHTSLTPEVDRNAVMPDRRPVHHFDGFARPENHSLTESEDDFGKLERCPCRGRHIILLTWARW